MGKREIVLAAKRKGLTFEVIEWVVEPTPGGWTAGWHIQLTGESICALVDHSFAGDVSPECRNATEVMGWVDALPNCTDRAAKQGANHG